MFDPQSFFRWVDVSSVEARQSTCLVKAPWTQCHQGLDLAFFVLNEMRTAINQSSHILWENQTRQNIPKEINLVGSIFYFPPVTPFCH